LLLGIAGVWIWYTHNQLWRQALLLSRKEAVSYLSQRGWILRDAGYRSTVILEGQLNDEEARFEWSGGVMGVSCTLIVGGHRTALEQARTSGDIKTILMDFQEEAN